MKCFKNKNNFTDGNDYVSKIRQRTLVNNIQNNNNNQYSNKQCNNNNYCCVINRSNSHNERIDIRKGFNLVTNKNLPTQNAYPYQNMCFNTTIANNNEISNNANSFPNILQSNK